MWMILFSLLFSASPPGNTDVLLSTLETQVKENYVAMKEAAPPLYYLAYRVDDEESVYLSATLGHILTDNHSRLRKLSIVLRVGSPRLDNTHEIKGAYDFSFMRFDSPELLPLEKDAGVIKRELWRLTQKKMRDAVERFKKVNANEMVMAKAEDTSDDFILAPPERDVRPPAPPLTVDRTKWREIVVKVSNLFRSRPEIISSSVTFSTERHTIYFADSSGTLLRCPETYVRLYVMARTQSGDGMPLFLHKSYTGFAEEQLPEEETILQNARSLADQLIELKRSPAAEPYVGPAIFLGQAAGVFFHEVMGHRLEGHRQKSEKEGQTFTKKIGQEVLPPFMDLVDDPTLASFKGMPLVGHYLYDDEGVKAQKAVLVKDGILKGFLMGRSPIKGFSHSNGHGRGSMGHRPVARQANLMVLPHKTVPFPILKENLIEMCREQGKPYGLIFSDVSGGFTLTGRFLQTFKVIPLVVYRVYTDGRPDQLVRGVDIVGTPLTALKKIVAASDDYQVFNGFCGAESGFIPVAAVSPSILVTEIEIEKKVKDMEKPPILKPPIEKRSPGVSSDKQGGAS